MKKYIAIAAAGAALIGAALPATASARVPTYAGGPIVGCQTPGMDSEWILPKVAPTRCTFVTHDNYSAFPLPASDQDALHGLRWSHWGRATATATGWLDDETGGPYRVTVKAWRLVTDHGFATEANIPICRDNIRRYSRVTITMPENAVYYASTWTDSGTGITRQC
jgi:hypothetical protein